MIESIKISELQGASDISNLYTIGADDNNQSYKVPLNNIPNGYVPVRLSIKNIPITEESFSFNGFEGVKSNRLRIIIDSREVCSHRSDYAMSFQNYRREHSVRKWVNSSNCNYLLSDLDEIDYNVFQYPQDAMDVLFDTNGMTMKDFDKERIFRPSEEHPAYGAKDYFLNWHPLLFNIHHKGDLLYFNFSMRLRFMLFKHCTQEEINAGIGMPLNIPIDGSYWKEITAPIPLRIVGRMDWNPTNDSYFNRYVKFSFGTAPLYNRVRAER